MSVQLRSFSFRFAEQVFNSRLQLKQEINEMLLEACKDLSVLGRPAFNRILKNLFVEKNWISQPRVSPEMKAYSKFDFMQRKSGGGGPVWPRFFYRNRFAEISDGFLLEFRSYRFRRLHNDYEGDAKILKDKI